MKSGATFSADRRYRWTLSRRWAEGQAILFVLLNASDADETNDDPTVRRCINFARDWGFGAMMIGNAFGLKSKEPKELASVDNPIGEMNDFALKAMFDLAALTVYGWGNHGRLFNRGQQVYELLGPALCFGVNKSGEPVHPLYQRRDAALIDYRRLDG